MESLGCMGPFWVTCDTYIWPLETLWTLASTAIQMPCCCKMAVVQDIRFRPGLGAWGWGFRV